MVKWSEMSKTTCPESPREASSPDASNDELTTGSKVTKGRSCGVTRYTAAKKQLDDALEETVRLKNVISLLESEIDLKNKELSKLRKNDISQKSEIKKLSILVDYQKHELRKDTTTSRDVPDRKNSCSSLNDCDNDSSVDDLVVVNRCRKSAKVQVVSARKPISSPLSKSVAARYPSGTILHSPSVWSSRRHRVLHRTWCRLGPEQAWCGCRDVYLPRLWGTADNRADQWHSDEGLPARYCSLTMQGKWFAK